VEIPLKESGDGLAGKDFVEKFVRHRVERIDFAVRLIIKTVRNGVDVGQFEARLLQAPSDRLAGKMGALLLTVEAFLSRSGDDPSGADQRGGGVVALGDAVIARIKVGPVPAFKGHGQLQAADPKNVHEPELPTGTDAFSGFK
jgi:hypothetical protein